MRTILDDSEPPRLGATNSIACGRYFRASGTLPTYVAERSLAFQLILICESARAYPQTPVKIPFELSAMAIPEAANRAVEPEMPRRMPHQLGATTSGQFRSRRKRYGERSKSSPPARAPRAECRLMCKRVDGCKRHPSRA